MDDHVGDVGALAADPLLDLARPRVRVVEPARALEAERQERDEPAVRAQEAQLARLGCRVASRDDRARRPPRRRPSTSRAVARSRRAARDASARRRSRARRRRSPPRAARRSSCASSSDRSPGSFTCSDSSVRPSTSTSARLCTSRTRGTPTAAACARSRRSRVLDRLDVHDDVRVRQRALDRRLDRVGRGVPLPDRGARRRRRSRRRRTGGRPPAACAGAAARPAGASSPIAATRRRLGLGRRAVHQHVDVRLDQPRRRRAARARRRRAPRSGRRSGSPPRANEEADRAPRPSRRGRCRSAARSRRAPRCRTGAPCATRRPCGSRRSRSRRRARRTRTSAACTCAVRRAGQPLDRADRDEDADERRGTPPRRAPRGAPPCRARTGACTSAGRAGDANREEREQRRDEVGARVGRLGDEPEAVRREADRRA